MLRLIGMGLAAAAVIGVLVAIGFYISPRDELEKSDTIIVISGGETVSRTLEAVRLYQEGWAPSLIFSGAALDPKSPSNARAMRAIAIEEGVPPDVIAVEESSQTTHQNANEVAAIIQALQHQQVILVTSPYHQRRASIEFEQRLGSDVSIINHSAIDHTWSRRWWWISPKGWYLTLTEIPKIAITSINQKVSE